MKKFLALLLVFVACCVFHTCAVVTNNPDGNNTFVNRADGYCFQIPQGYIMDTSFYPIAMCFESEDTTIEIYAQECGSSDERLGYINYTNSAIVNNKIDYSDVAVFTDEQYTTVLSWNREKLSRIENDKNFYLKIDIPTDSRVYTMLLKSTKPLAYYTNYRALISFHNDIVPETRVAKKHAREPKFNEETQAFYNRYFSDDAELSWGIYHSDYLSDDSLKTIENSVDFDFEFVLWYKGLFMEYNKAREMEVFEKAYAEGKVVESTLQPQLNHAPGNDLFRLLNGYYDDFLNSYARDIAEFGHPVMFRFANEMNGDWCEYSGYRMSLDTELYREMYRYVQSIFEKNGADNVIWIWNPNGESFPSYKWNSEVMYYPGDDHVDVLGLTLYNTGTFYPGETWKTFEELYAPLYAEAIKKYDMPFMITEFACARTGGDKEEWTRKMLDSIDSYSNIKIAVWWNGADFTANKEIARNYYIDETEEMLNIFRGYLSKKNK